MNFLKKLLLCIFCIVNFTCFSVAKYTKDNLRLYIRTNAPKTSIPKIMNFVKQIVNDQYFDAELTILASSIGHPNYEGLSEKENVAIFVFKEKNQFPENIIVARFQSNSALKNSLIKSGLHIKDIDNWSFISTKQSNLENLDDVQWMIKTTEKKLKTDIEICPIPERLSEELNIDTVNQLIGIQDEQSLAAIRPLLDAIRNRIDDLKQIIISATFDKQSTLLNFSAHARLGTDTGEIFSMKSGGTTKIPQCTFKNPPIFSIFSCIDVNQYKMAIEALQHQLLKSSDVKAMDEKIQIISSYLDNLIDKFNGQQAIYIFNNADSNIDKFVIISHGTFNVSHAKEICHDMLPKLNANWKFDTNNEIKYQKQSIYLCNNDNTNVYTCICKNNLLISNDIDILHETIDNILKNKSKVTLKEDCALTVYFDPKAVLNTIDKKLLPYDFSTMEIKPVIYEIKLKDKKYTGSLFLDNTSLKNIVKTLLYVDEQSNNEKNDNTSE